MAPTTRSTLELPSVGTWPELAGWLVKLIDYFECKTEQQTKVQLDLPLHAAHVGLHILFLLLAGRFSAFQIDLSGFLLEKFNCFSCQSAVLI